MLCSVGSYISEKKMRVCALDSCQSYWMQKIGSMCFATEKWLKMLCMFNIYRNLIFIPGSCRKDGSRWIFSSFTCFSGILCAVKLRVLGLKAYCMVCRLCLSPDTLIIFVVETFGAWTPFALRTLITSADRIIPPLPVASGVEPKLAKRNLLQYSCL